MIKEILVYIGVAILLLFVLKIFRIKWKLIISILINTLIGGLALFLINYIPGVNLEISIVNSLFVGILGVPAVIVLIVMYFIK